jgi:hypothetical protein
MSVRPGDPRALLAHDVGKYVSRTARNLPPGPVPPPLLEMLAKDLWALPAGGTASEVFARLAAPLRGAPSPDPRLAGVGACLAEIDGLEADVRAGRDAAVRRACALALEVETLLRTMAREARGAP